MSEKDLDNLFKSKLGERAFKYNPKAWQAMEQILDSRKRGLAFYWRTAAAVLAFFGLSLVFALNQPKMALQQNELSTPVSIMQDAENPMPSVEVESTKPTNSALNNKQNEPTTNSVAVVPSSKSNTSITGATSPNAPTYKKEHKNPVVITGDETNVESKNSKVVASSSEVLLEVEPIQSDVLVLPELELNQMTIATTEGDIKNVNKKSEISAKQLGIYPFIRMSGMTSSINLNATNGYGFSAGGGIEKSIGKHFSVAAGINYVQRSRPGLNKSSDSVFYGFTAERKIKEEEILRTHHVEMPLTLTFLANSRHRIGAGVSAAYLIDSEASVATQESRFEELVKSSKSVENVLKHELNAWNFGAHLQYQFLIAPRLSIGTSLHYSFSDFTLETPTNQRLTDVRLFLQYAF